MSKLSVDMQEVGRMALIIEACVNPGDDMADWANALIYKVRAAKGFNEVEVRR